jgi:hypothetical protein
VWHVTNGFVRRFEARNDSLVLTTTLKHRVVIVPTDLSILMDGNLEVSQVANKCGQTRNECTKEGHSMSLVAQQLLFDLTRCRPGDTS